MRSEKSTSKSFRSLETWGIVLASFLFVACSGVPVVEVDPCIEIPFVDAPEGACTNTVTHKAYLVNATDWAKQRPTMIMLRARDWSKIRTAWLKACVGNEDCNVYVYTVDRAVKDLDRILKTVVKP